MRIFLALEPTFVLAAGPNDLDKVTREKKKKGVRACADLSSPSSGIARWKESSIEVSEADTGARERKLKRKEGKVKRANKKIRLESEGRNRFNTLMYLMF